MSVLWLRVFGLGALPAPHVPQLGGVVKRPCDEFVPVLVEAQTHDLRCVSCLILCVCVKR